MGRMRLYTIVLLRLYWSLGVHGRTGRIGYRYFWGAGFDEFYQNGFA